jgi:hypothetical protein
VTAAARAAVGVPPPSKEERDGNDTDSSGDDAPPLGSNLPSVSKMPPMATVLPKGAEVENPPQLYAGFSCADMLALTLTAFTQSIKRCLIGFFCLLSSPCIVIVVLLMSHLRLFLLDTSTIPRSY